jgi:hypothetical protein
MRAYPYITASRKLNQSQIDGGPNNANEKHPRQSALSSRRQTRRRVAHLAALARDRAPLHRRRGRTSPGLAPARAHPRATRRAETLAPTQHDRIRSDTWRHDRQSSGPAGQGRTPGHLPEWMAGGGGRQHCRPVQQREFASESSGYTATRHQHEVGAGYFDLVAMAVSGGLAATTAMHASTEVEQFSPTASLLVSAS